MMKHHPAALLVLWLLLISSLVLRGMLILALDLPDLLELLGLALMLLEYPAAFFDLSCFDMMVYSSGLLCSDLHLPFF